MNIFGPQHSQPAHRIQPIDNHPDDQSQEEKRRRRSQHQGRIWDQREKGDVEKPAFLDLQESKDERMHGLYGNTLYVEKASKLFDELTTLEEKVAQLCFYQTEAVYDTSIQQNVELLIQAWQIGGLLFTKGQYRRQGYLIERYQELSKTPLLIGNDFLHGLSFYFEGGELPDLQQPGLEKRFSDLGKAVMGLNRRLSVHFQFDRERLGKHLPIKEEQLRAFRKGVRQANGIVGRENIKQRKAEAQASQTQLHIAGNPKFMLSPQHASEFVGVKTLNFLDLTQDRVYDEKLVKAFKENYDIFLFGSNIQDAIRMICRAVKMGRISEEEIDRRVMKLLVLKNQYS
ncbi:MAG: hypothetical protein H7A36_04840 [Chlamydiales bacterium]|nr:hypothetical protein [Chlamydiales bacterium]